MPRSRSCTGILLWIAAYMVEPPDGAPFGFFTSMSLASGCDGMCEVTDWEQRLRGPEGYLTNWASDGFWSPTGEYLFVLIPVTLLWILVTSVILVRSSSPEITIDLVGVSIR